MGKIFLKNISLEGRQSDIRIEGSLITSVAPHAEGAPAPEGFDVVDCTGKAAVPGFINMHTHAAMTLFRGIGEDMVLQDWLAHIWSLESLLNEEFVYQGTRVAALEMIKTGTTTFNDMYWYCPAARRACAEAGLRSMLSYCFLDNFDEGAASRQKDEFVSIHEATRSWGPLTGFCASIHAEYTVSEPLIIWVTEYARSHGLRIHLHLSETEAEVEKCKAAHGGLSPVEYFDSLGVLGPDVIAAHSLWLSEKDIEILGERKVNCVHNVNSNLKLSSGYRFLLSELVAAGANVCLGTDGCASSNNLDILETMKTSAMVQKAWRNDPTVLPLPDLLDMATVNGGKALGIRAGRIEEGWEADIQIVDTDNTFFLSPAPFLANYVYSAHSDCISSLICGGEFVMRDRVVPGEREILEGGRKALEIIRQ